MTWLLDGLSWLFVLAGGFLVLVGGIGLLRLPHFFNRLHAVGVTESLGAGLVLLGLLLQAPTLIAAAKLVLILGFLVLTSPTAAHALSKAARHGGVRPDEADRKQP